jgi:hypothetical protein
METHERSPGELKQKYSAQEEENIVDFYLVEKIEEEEESPVSARATKEAVSIEMKPLPAHLQYQFIDDDKKFPVIVSARLKDVELKGLLAVLKRNREVIGYSLDDMKGISSAICSHRIYLVENTVPTREHQRRLNPHLQEVVKKEILKLLAANIIYPISDSSWVSPIHMVPKKGGIIVVENDSGELIPTRPSSGWRMCTDFRKLNKATRKDHFPLPFIDQTLERLAWREYFCYLDGYSGFLQIPIHFEDQDKTTFTCPYGTFSYRRLPIGLCNAPGTFQRCMMSLFSNLNLYLIIIKAKVFSWFGLVWYVVKSCASVHKWS